MIKQNLKTLIVEPEASAATTLREVFERFGFQVAVATNLASALEALSLEEFDLLTVDCLLPDENGQTCLAHIRRELEKGQCKTKVIAAAPEVTIEVRLKCAASGVNGILAKPFSFIPVAETLFTLN